MEDLQGNMGSRGMADFPEVAVKAAKEQFYLMHVLVVL